MKSASLLILILITHFISVASSAKQILLLGSYNSRFPTFMQQIEGVKSVLNTPDIYIDVEFMDSKRFPDSTTYYLFYQSISNKIKTIKKYDAIIATDDNAFDFCLRYQQTLFKDTPIIFCSVNNINRGKQQDKNPNVCGIIETVPIRETLELMLKLFPDKKTLYAIFDSTVSGQMDYKTFLANSANMPSYTFKSIDLSKLTFNEYAIELRKIPADVPVLLIAAFLDKTHATVDFNESLSILNNNLKAPLFHLWEHGLGNGVFGGRIISQYEQAKTAATLVKKILDGTPISSLKVIDECPTTYMFDYNQLTRYGIRKKQLPPESIIINQPHALLRENYKIATTTLIVFLCLLALIIALLFNIKKRKAIEKKLRKHNETIKKLNNELLISQESIIKESNKFRALFRNHNSVKLLIDPENGRIFDANKAATAFYGWSLDELKLMRITQIDTNSESTTMHHLEIVNYSNQRRTEYKHRLANGNIIDVEVFSSRVTIDDKNYVYSLIHDISDKKVFEHKSIILSRAVEQTPLAISVTNKNGVIEYINPAFTIITGITQDEVVGKVSKGFNICKSPQSPYNSKWKLLQAGNTWSNEMEYTKKTGEKRWISFTVSPIFDKNNELVEYVRTIEDITEKRKMLNELINAKEKAEESNKLKTEFLQNMSHEIRTPMNGIIGFSDLLSDKTITKEKRSEYVDIVQKCCHQLLHIIDDILEISRLNSKQVSISKEQFYLKGFLKDIYSVFEKKPRCQTVKTNLYINNLDDLDVVETDKTKLYNILNNFLNNAIKFTNEGFIEFGCNVEPTQIEFYVRDTGIGISEKNIEKVFNRFEQEEKEISMKQGGLGLGLSISKENAKLLNGNITVRSEKGIGSTFYLTIPNSIVCNKSLGTSHNSMSTLNSSKNKATILVAEDEETNFLYLSTILANNPNIELIHAPNGQVAVDICLKNHNISLILMDIKMPIMNGYDATRIIRMENPNIPIIAITAYSSAVDKGFAQKCGCNDFLSKPFNRNKFIDLINNYIA